MAPIPAQAPQEVFSQEASVRADGSFVFENVEIPLNRIFFAQVNFQGTDIRSDFAIVKEGDTSLSLPPITLYNKNEDTSKLVVDEVRIFFEYGTDSIQVFSVYSFHNPGEEAIVIKLDKNGELPSFSKPPKDSSGFGYEPMQDGEKLIQTQDGFEVPPSKGSYGLITFASLPTTKKFEFSQQFVLPVSSVTVFVPEGVKVADAQSQDLGVQAMQNFTFQIYQLKSVGAGENLELTVSGTPKKTTTPGSAQAASNQNLLIGVGALGLVLILAGAWMYLRDRNSRQGNSEEAEEDEFDSADDVMDAIIALDDLHRAKKISDVAYQKRRAELKEILKEKM